MIAEVILNSNAKQLNRVFDYEIPSELAPEIKLGARVLVPFSNRKELEEGFVVNIKEKSDYKVKSIVNINANYLDEKSISLARWMAERYFCNVSDCIKLMLPPGTTTKILENRVKEKNANFVYLKKSVEDIEQDIQNKKVKSEKQIRALEFLINNEGVIISDLETFADVSKAVLNTLLKNGYIEIVEKQIERNPFVNKDIKKDSSFVLNEEQQKAYNAVSDAIEDNFNSEFLLFGVTGSGKTEVYLQLIEKVLNEGKTSLMLVPEIALTPQTVDRFIARFGEDNIAVLHSKLSMGERYDQWNKIKKDEAKIVIGARSAIFAPIQNLGLIIMDEEHDQSYKSETTPKYHAREIARYLAKENSISLVLGSATPDLETFYKTQTGEIKLLELSKRANNAKLPNVEIVDLRNELEQGNKTMISGKLYKAIKENLQNNKQTILFLNRRGFSTFVMCRECGHTIKCKNCDITLTYHANSKKLKCHYCGYEEEIAKECPKCHSKNIKYFGAGTQKLEEQIHLLFPEASTIRMDVDTVTKKNSHEEILNKFKKDNINILIGTQMVVKGHHFPNVTLVGVIAADTSLNIDDFKANEHTFQILTQVARKSRERKGTRKGNNSNI
jgi:primosomal protein N'